MPPSQACVLHRLGSVSYTHLDVYKRQANTGQKPASVIEATDDFYRRHNANVSRAVHTLGSEATEAYEGARRKLATFLGVQGDDLVLCSGTTFAINLVAYSWALPRLKAGDAILITRMEHHANICLLYTSRCV